MRPPAPARLPELFQANPIDFRALYHVLRERSWVVGLCLLIAIFGTAAYLLRATKIYASKVLVQVEQEEQKILNIETVRQENPQSVEFLRTVEETLANRAVLAQVIEVNKLAQDPRFVPATVRPRPTQDQLVSMLATMVEVRLRKGTRLIDIRVEHADPGLTALVANALVTEFLRQNNQLNASASSVANEFLIAEAEELKRKLEQSEMALQAYREEMQSTSMEDIQNVVMQKLKELTAKVTDAKSQRILSQTAYKQVQQLGQDVEALLVIPAVANLPAIAELRMNIARLESEIATLKQRYRAKHPKYVQAESQLTEWRNALTKAVLNVGETFRTAYESAKAAEQGLEQAFRDQEMAALELNKQAIRYGVLSREVESDRALYQSVLNRIKETSVTKDLNQNRIRVIQPAVTPERPIKPEKLKIVLFGLFAGLTGGVLLAFLLNALDRSLKTVDQAEDCLGLPVLAAVPRFAGLAVDQRKVILTDETQSVEAESFRTLRTAMSMLGRKEDRRTFLFTSALPEEGKTFCSLNFAASLAQQGLRTLVVDCDLRRPVVERTLIGKHRRGLGLTDYLTGQNDLGEVVHPTEIENFFYIPAGSPTPNPAELLAQTGIDGLIDEALGGYDRIVVDSAPLHAVSDTLLVLSRIRTVCLVVRVRRTPRDAVLRAVQMLKEAGAPLAGVVLNLMPRRRGGGCYYDSYYEYTYRGYYNQDNSAQSPAPATSDQSVAQARG